MAKIVVRCAFLAIAQLLMAGAADQRQARPVPELVVTGDGIVAVTISGIPGRIRVDPAVPSLPLVTSAYAGRARLRAGPFAFGYMVGPERVNGRSAVTRIGVGGGAQPRRRRVGWTERPYFAGTDAVIGPGGLQQPIIRFVLRPTQAGERIIALPLADEGGLFGGYGGMYALIELGGQPLRVRFNPYQPRTLATAGAGVRIAAAHEGRVSGETENVEIAFGIQRPVRALRLATPLRIGHLAISALGVRTRDFGNATAIQEEGERGDPDEIVVTGQRERDTGRDRLSLGADRLAGCSSIIFDKRARQIRLSCL